MPGTDAERSLDRVTRYVAGLRPHFQTYWVDPNKTEKKNDGEAEKRDEQSPHEGGGMGARTGDKKDIIKKVKEAGGDPALAENMIKQGVGKQNKEASAALQFATASMMGDHEHAKAAVEKMHKNEKGWVDAIEDAVARGEELAHTVGPLVQASQQAYDSPQTPMWFIVEGDAAKVARNGLKSKGLADLKTDLLVRLTDKEETALASTKKGALVVQLLVMQQAIIFSHRALPMPVGAEKRGDVIVVSRGVFRVRADDVLSGNEAVAKSFTPTRNEGKGTTPVPVADMLKLLGAMHEQHLSGLRGVVKGIYDKKLAPVRGS